MLDTSSFNPVAHLRKILGKTQAEFALLLQISRNAVASLESGRLRLSVRLATKMAEQTNVNPHWLLAGDASAPMVNLDNQPWRQEDYEAAQKTLQERDLAVELREREMAVELCTAYSFLQRALQAASQRDAFAVSQFQHRLENFIRGEVHRYGELRDDVYAKIRDWNEQYVAPGRTGPKRLLFPRDAATFKQSQRDFAAALEWMKEWEKQISPPTLRAGKEVGRKAIGIEPKPRRSRQEGIAQSKVVKERVKKQGSSKRATFPSDYITK